LTSIFDKYIWISMATLLIIAAIFSSLVLKHHKQKEDGEIATQFLDIHSNLLSIKDYILNYLIPSILSYFRALVEQGIF